MALASRLQSFETDMLTQETNFVGLAAINRELVAKANTIEFPQRRAVSEVSTGNLGTSALFHSPQTVLHAKRSGPPCMESPLCISFWAIVRSKRKSCV